MGGYDLSNPFKSYLNTLSFANAVRENMLGIACKNDLTIPCNIACLAKKG
jgi:hypothetical protein